MGTQTLFPPSSDEELRALRRKCASALWALVPQTVGRLYFGGSASSWLAARLSTNDMSGAKPTTLPRSGPIDITNASGKDQPDARIITEIETDILDAFSDAYCNKHLMYSALELVLVRLIPELAEKSIVGLWNERLS